MHRRDRQIYHYLYLWIGQQFLYTARFGDPKALRLCLCSLQYNIRARLDLQNSKFAWSFQINRADIATANNTNVDFLVQNAILFLLVELFSLAKATLYLDSIREIVSVQGTRAQIFWQI